MENKTILGITVGTIADALIAQVLVYFCEVQILTSTRVSQGGAAREGQGWWIKLKPVS